MHRALIIAFILMSAACKPIQSPGSSDGVLFLKCSQTTAISRTGSDPHPPRSGDKYERLYRIDFDQKDIDWWMTAGWEKRCANCAQHNFIATQNDVKLTGVGKNPENTVIHFDRVDGTIHSVDSYKATGYQLDIIIGGRCDRTEAPLSRDQLPKKF